jgi:hypothetical protein
MMTLTIPSSPGDAAGRPRPIVPWDRAKHLVDVVECSQRGAGHNGRKFRRVRRFPGGGRLRRRPQQIFGEELFYQAVNVARDSFDWFQPVSGADALDDGGDRHLLAQVIPTQHSHRVETKVASGSQVEQDNLVAEVLKDDVRAIALKNHGFPHSLPPFLY